jgi:hypothetical protein
VSARQPRRRQASPRQATVRGKMAKVTKNKPAGPNILKTAAWRRLKHSMLTPFVVCHLCGHGAKDGSPCDTLDHIQSRTDRPDLGLDPGNVRPVHHEPCRTCSIAAGRAIWCNNLRGAFSVPRARKLIAERTGLGIYVPEGGERIPLARIAPPPPPPEPVRPEPAFFPGQLDEPEAEPEPALEVRHIGAEYGGATYLTIGEALADLSPLAPEDAVWLWSHAHWLGCEHGQAGDEGRCWDCLPMGRELSMAVLKWASAHYAA